VRGERGNPCGDLNAVVSDLNFCLLTSSFYIQLVLKCMPFLR